MLVKFPSSPVTESNEEHRRKLQIRFEGRITRPGYIITMPRMTHGSSLIVSAILMITMMARSGASVSSSSLVAVAGCDGRSDKKELQAGRDS